MMTRMTIGQLLDRAVQRFGDRTAYVFDSGGTITFTELARRVEDTARGLIAAGVARGDRVAIWMPNNPEWLLAYLAVARIGAVLVPVNTAFRVDEAAYVIGQSDSVMLVVGSGKRDLVSDAAGVLADERVHVRDLVVVGSSIPAGATSWADLLQRAAEVPEAEFRGRIGAVRPDDVVLMLYTSGTTGFPKGAMHSHKIIQNMVDAAERMQHTGEDVLVLYLPLFHIFGAGSVLTFLHTGGKIVLQREFDAARSLRVMEQERATVVYGIGTMYYDQIHHPDFPTHDLESARICLAPGTGDLVRLVSARMGPTINGYGMTESSGFTALPDPRDDIHIRAETLGFPLPGFEIRVLDVQGRPVVPDVPGELFVRGHPVMHGYYEKPEETAAVLDTDGWFRTGDLVTRSAEGRLRFVGRAKDMFRVGGENVDPVEIEQVLMSHPAVSIAAAFGVPHARLGEAAAAVVQCRSGSTAQPAELVAFVAGKLASFKCPRRIDILDAIPTTGSGKIQKFKAREDFLARSG